MREKPCLFKWLNVATSRGLSFEEETWKSVSGGKRSLLAGKALVQQSVNKNAMYYVALILLGFPTTR